VSKINARHSGHEVIGDKKINAQFARSKGPSPVRLPMPFVEKNGSSARATVYDD
jgi:hypothetical protein